jgi:hypothetical protein
MTNQLFKQWLSFAQQEKKTIPTIADKLNKRQYPTRSAKPMNPLQVQGGIKAVNHVNKPSRSKKDP